MSDSLLHHESSLPRGDVVQLHSSYFFIRGLAGRRCIFWCGDPRYGSARPLRLVRSSTGRTRVILSVHSGERSSSARRLALLTVAPSRQKPFRLLHMVFQTRDNLHTYTSYFKSSFRRIRQFGSGRLIAAVSALWRGSSRCRAPGL